MTGTVRVQTVTEFLLPTVQPFIGFNHISYSVRTVVSCL